MPIAAVGQLLLLLLAFALAVLLPAFALALVVLLHVEGLVDVVDLVRVYASVRGGPADCAGVRQAGRAGSFPAAAVPLEVPVEADLAGWPAQWRS